MRFFLGILLFLVWSIASSFWYVCKIKCLCNNSSNIESIKVFDNSSNKCLMDLKESIEVTRNSALPLISGNTSLLSDSFQLLLTKNPDKTLLIKSFLSIDELKINPKIGLERAQFLKKMLFSNLQDSFSIDYTQEVEENLFIKDISYNSIKFLLIDKNQNDSLSNAETATNSQKEENSEVVNNASGQNTSTPVQTNESINYNPTSSSSSTTSTSSSSPSSKSSTSTNTYYPPTPKPTESPRPTETSTSSNNVNFDSGNIIFSNYISLGTYGKYDLEINAEVASMIKDVQEILISKPNAKVKIIGHTCEISGEKFNYGLGLKRAQTFKQLLIDNGIPSSQVKAVSKGLTQPLVPNISDENRQINRRIEIVVLD